MGLTNGGQSLFNGYFLSVVFQFYKLFGSGYGPRTYDDEFVTIL